jgi:serine/threonine protein kinase
MELDRKNPEFIDELSREKAAIPRPRNASCARPRPPPSSTTPNICPVYEVDESGGEMFLTMAFVEGRSLKERIAEGPLPLIEVLNVAVQVAEGLKTAHERGVVHRDIKPANIMLNREGQVRITDFGLASIEGGADLTRPLAILGTPAYMSPEQVRGERTDGRTDIWSFGVTLFEMTTGRRPFLGPVCLAWSLAALENFDGAIEWLKTAVREHDTLTHFINVYTPFLAPDLARDPRFGAILDRLGLPR